MPPILLNRWVQLALGSTSALVIGFALGHHQKTLEDKAAQVGAFSHEVARVSASAQATSVVDRKSTAAQTIIQAATASNLQKVSLYVPRKADDQCIVGVGAVRLLDAAAQGVAVPAAAGDSLPAADSGVALSVIVSDGVVNAGSYQTLVQRLKAWDDWYDAQAAIAAGKPPPDAPPPT